MIRFTPFDFTIDTSIERHGINIDGGSFASAAYATLEDKITTIASHRPKEAEAHRKAQLLACETEARKYAKRYQDAVAGVLAKVRYTHTGRAVTDQIASVQHEVSVRITPYNLPDDDELAQPDGSKVQISPNASSEADSVPRGVPLRKDNRRNKRNAHVRYTPFHWEKEKWERFVRAAYKNATPAQEEWGAGTPPDEVLLHELIHAMFTVLGKGFSRRVVGQGKRYKASKEKRGKPGEYRNIPSGQMSEFMAALITDIHRSEMGRKGIRMSHVDDKTKFVSDKDFLRIGLNRTHIRLLRRRVPVLFNRLHGIETA